MSLAHHRLTLPESLQTQLLEFRRRVWTIKLVEAVCGAVIGILLAFLATFALDRVFDTPWEVRLGIFVVAMVGCGLIPLALHRWIWRQRKLEQLARLLARKHPSVGDQLLGIIELVHSESEQALIELASPTPVESWEHWALPRAQQELLRIAQLHSTGATVPHMQPEAFVVTV